MISVAISDASVPPMPEHGLEQLVERGAGYFNMGRRPAMKCWGFVTTRKNRLDQARTWRWVKDEKYDCACGCGEVVSWSEMYCLV